MAKRVDEKRRAEKRRRRLERRRAARRPARTAAGSDRPPETRLAATPRPRRRYGNASVALSTFIDIDEAERFDIFEVNGTDFWGLDKEVIRNRAAARAVMEDIDDIIARVEREISTPAACGEILRRRVLEWSRYSASNPDWRQRARARWGGLFYESREPGRRLRPSLIDRLLRFRSVAVEGARLPGFRVQRLMDAGGQENEGGHAPGEVHLRASQAVLDDLANAPRSPGGAHPLVRLSELADRIGRTEVTKALADIFSSESRDMIVVLHPSRYPGADFVGIQPPPRRARGPWLTYTLVIAPVQRAPAVTSTAAGPAPQRSAPARAAPAGGPAAPPPAGRAPSPPAVQVPAQRLFAPRVTFAAPVAIFPGASIWDMPTVTPEQWAAELRSTSTRGERTESPPLASYRKSAAFRALRELLLSDGEARTTFVQTAWRGKPRGLPLLAALLRDGVLQPEYETDASYLEAELEPFAARGGVPRSGQAAWKLPHGWSVQRLVDGGILRYEATQGG